MPGHHFSAESSRLVPLSQPLAHGKPQVPNHELIRCFGSGAFGEVWLARNIMGTYRATKVVYRDSFSDERPYQREFRGLQKFEPISRSHDGFIDILDAGLNDAEGYFFYVMELADDVVSGSQIEPDRYEPKTLDKEAGKGRCAPVQTCVSLGVSLSAALSHLHRNGLVHRDIKPSNIIFVNGIPKIADIGLVSMVEGTQTFAGGTQGYFPPNEGPGTVQADIYALGKVLYELATGQDRFEYPELPARLDEIQDPDQFRELNQVILRACEDDPHKRYSKAEDLHADLLLLMAGKSVRRIRALEKRVERLIRVGVAAVLLLLVTGSALYGWNRHLRRVAEQKQEQVRHNVARGNSLVDGGDFFGAIPYFLEALRLEHDVPMAEKNDRLRIGALLQQCPRMTEQWFLNGQTLNAAALSPDGQFVITAAVDGTATLCDVTQSSKPEIWPKDNTLEAVSFSPNGRYVATAGNGFAKVWERATHTLLSIANPASFVYSVKFNPDGSQFVTASGNDTEGHVCLYDTKNPGLGAELAKGAYAYRCAAFSPDGTRLVTACEDGFAQLWDLTTRQRMGTAIDHNQGLKTNWVFCAAFSPDGRRVATGSYDGSVQVCDAESGRRILRLRHPEPVKSLEFSPDGRYLVTGCWDYTTRIWDAATGDLVSQTMKQSGKNLICVSFSPDCRRVLSASTSGVICMWDLATPMRHPAEGHLLASQDGRRLCAVQGNNIDVFDPINRAHASRLVLDGVRNIILNKDGHRLITLSHKAQSTNLTTVAQLWNTDTAIATALSPEFFTDSAPTDAFLSDDGGRLLTSRGKQAIVWDALAGRPLFSLDHPDGMANADYAGTDKSGCFSPNGAWLATITMTNVYVWNAVKGNLSWVLPHPDSVEHLAFSPDSRLLVTCCGSPGTFVERAAQLWQMSNGKPLGPPLQHADGVVYAEFSRDGTHVVTASEDGTACVWEVATGRLYPLPLQHASTVIEARFSLDGRWIVTACENSGIARVWDALTGDPLTPPLTQPWPFKHAQFVADGNEILCKRSRVKGGGVSALWELPIETRSFEELAELARVLSGQQRDARGAVVPQKPEELQKAWERLRAQHPGDFTVSKEDIVNWHLREAEASEKAEQWGAALFHWNYVLEAEPTVQIYRDRQNHARDHLADSFPDL